MPAPLSILLLNWRDLDHPESGGSEKYLVEVARGLAARGHAVTLRTALYPGALKDEVLDGVRYMRRGGHYSVYLRSLAWQLLRRRHYDVVVDVQNGVPFMSPLVRRGPVVNLVHHVHREQWPVVFVPFLAKVGWWLEATLAPRLYRHSRYVAVSSNTRRELGELGVDLEHISVIPNGTDALAHHTARRSNHPVVSVLGRLVPHKRVEIAMEAAAVLAIERPDLELRIIGSGYWEPELRECAEILGITNRVTFTGHVSEAEKHQHLAESWVLALPSLKEGWGLVVVEAGVHGTPTVAFHEAGGPTDSILDGETGLLVHGGVLEFTAAIGVLLDDSDLRDGMSKAAVDWVTQFRWPETVERWEQALYAVSEHDKAGQ